MVAAVVSVASCSELIQFHVLSTQAVGGDFLQRPTLHLPFWSPHRFLHAIHHRHTSHPEEARSRRVASPEGMARLMVLLYFEKIAPSFNMSLLKLVGLINHNISHYTIRGTSMSSFNASRKISCITWHTILHKMITATNRKNRKQQACIKLQALQLYI